MVKKQHPYKRGRDHNRHNGGSSEDSDSSPEHRRGRRNQSIIFNDDDFTGVETQWNDPMVITLEIETMDASVWATAHRVLIDQGSSADILYYDGFIRSGLKDSMLRQFAGALSGDEKGEIKGYIDLKTTFGKGDHAKTINVRYLVVDSVSAYNINISRPSLNKLGAIVSTPHLTMKYPLSNGKVGVVRADQKKTTS